ncbi:unnamed protein product [Musa acuminata subsp. burmannicoides]
MEQQESKHQADACGHGSIHLCLHVGFPDRPAETSDSPCGFICFGAILQKSCQGFMPFPFLFTSSRSHLPAHDEMPCRVATEQKGSALSMSETRLYVCHFIEQFRSS